MNKQIPGIRFKPPTRLRGVPPSVLRTRETTAKLLKNYAPALPLKRLLILCLLTLCTCCRAQENRSDRQSLTAINQAANQILRHQTRDGAIVMGALPSQKSQVMPYFANFAGLGLVAAYREAHDPRYLAAAKRWADWYEAHQNSDGTINDYTGVPGAWKSTGDYDSTDSYAATYLELLLTLYRVTSDGKWLRAKFPSATQALAAIRLTLQPRGLTIAKPTYPVMYTMDNVETTRGLQAPVEICRIVNDKAVGARAAEMAYRMDVAITRDLWDASRQCYRIGVQTDGGKEEGLTKWYPDVMANLMAIGWRPRSERHRTLWIRLKTEFSAMLPTTLHSEDDLEHLCWWGWAARGAGDITLSAEIAARLRRCEAALPAVANPGLLGHICRLLARQKG